MNKLIRTLLMRFISQARNVSHQSLASSLRLLDKLSTDFTSKIDLSGRKSFTILTFFPKICSVVRTYQVNSYNCQLSYLLTMQPIQRNTKKLNINSVLINSSQESEEIIVTYHTSVGDAISNGGIEPNRDFSASTWIEERHRQAKVSFNAAFVMGMVTDVFIIVVAFLALNGNVPIESAMSAAGIVVGVKVSRLLEISKDSNDRYDAAAPKLLDKE